MTRDYLRKVHYHETDKMGVTHHTNYIKWMEEARIDFLDQIGWSGRGLFPQSSAWSAGISIPPPSTTRSASR